VTDGRVEIECRDSPGVIPRFLVWLVSPDDTRVLFHDGEDYAEACAIARTAGTRFGPVRDLFAEARGDLTRDGRNSTDPQSTGKRDGETRN